MNLQRLLPSLLIMLGAFGLFGCGDDGPTDGGTPPPGTLRLSLTDAPTPIEGVEALTLLLSEVRVNHSVDDEDGQWYDILPDTLTQEERTINLLDYANGEFFLIGEELLPAGTYEQIRLVIEESTVTVDGVEYALTIPSGSTSGLKLVTEFEVESEAVIGLILDFDVGRSLFAAPPGSTNFKLKPVIRVIAENISGGVSGTVLPVDIDAMVMAVSADLSDTATVYVEVGTGAYQISALTPGEWSLTAMAPGYVSQSASPVDVSAGAIAGPIDFTLEAEIP
jgi:hypothetical protein